MMPCYDGRDHPDYIRQQEAYKEHGMAARCLHFFLKAHGEDISPKLKMAAQNWEEGHGLGFDDENWVEALCSRIRQAGKDQMIAFVASYIEHPETAMLLSWWNRHRQKDEELNNGHIDPS